MLSSLYICLVQRFFLFFGIFLLWAQPLPDSVWYVEPPQDTIFLTTYQVSNFGWAATTYRREGSSWRLLGTDTVFLDAQNRISRILRYLDTATAPVPPSLAPYERTEAVYPGAGYLTFTKYDYDLSQALYVPRRRVHVWNAAQRWDSVLSGQLGILALGWSLYQGERLWPSPALTHAKHWGDSLLVEDFDDGANVFVEAGGYFFHGLSDGCDSLLPYEPPRNAPQLIGYYKRCYALSGQLITQMDSFRTPVPEWIVQARLLMYDAQGYLQKDSLQLRFYTPQGNPMGSMDMVRRYGWDAQGRLVEAEYPGGKYLLRYGGQVVQLSTSAPAPQLVFKGREGQLIGELSRTPLQLYDFMGREVGGIALESEGYFRVLETVPPGFYILRAGLLSWRIAVGL